MNPSAGQADPFWYEWYVGLEKVIEMLHPDTEIASVEFQARGIKGWDDVVVRFQAGAVHRYQVKHSRTGTNLTFGSLVQPEAGASLLSALFDAWKQLGDFRGSALFSLYTNREAGHQASTSDSGVTRPALGQFIAWLDSALNEHSCIAKIVPPIGWAGAWCEWLGQLKGSDAEQHGFLSALKIETGRDELPVFEDRLLGLLQENFATSRDRAIGLFQSLTHELRVWTTSRQNRPVEVEDVLQALALDSEALDESPPPPPAPFFESRARFLQEIISALTSGPKVVFLCGEPGAGKTSLVSNLSMRRMERSMSGLVGLRYFAYRPITVESPVIPADADKYIQPERLWYTLLSQLRRGLRGRLRNYRVPVRNELISWSDARGHVLRIADELGRELQHDFVIVIDGIDHAARASRYDARASKEFFNSLPGPDELAPLRIRLLLAGQPPTAYPQYPHWITIERPDVSRLDVGKLDDADIRLLLNATSPTLIQSCGDAAVRLVRNETGGNTLATVFATAESKHCRDLEEFQQRLGQRRLKDGLVQYYQGIWSHATGGDGPRDAALALASMFFAARERVTPRILATAFSTLGRSELVWQQSLDALEPLIINDPDGYRVRHNDVRVFLHSVLESSSQASRRAVMGMMFDYYTTGSPNRLAAHRSALHLAQESGRLHDWPKIYSLHWVFEAASLGLPYQEIQGECVVAVEQAMLLRDWNLMLQVACAAETLEAWDSSWNEVNASDSLKPSEKHEVAFLRAEGIVTPLDRWSVRELNEVLDDVSSLIGGANQARATALLTRWFGGMTRFQLLTKIGGLDGDGNSRDAFARQDPCLELIKRFGAVFRSAGFFLPKGKGVAPTKDGRPLVFDFEMGWVNASAPGSHAATMDEVFAGIPPKFYGTIAIAVENLADVGYWHLVSELLENAPLDRSHFSKPFMARAAWWSLRAGLGVQGNPWLDVLQQPRFGLEESNDHDVTCGTDVARSFGWLNVAWDSGTIGRKVYDALSSGRRGRSDSHYVAVYRAAAVLGRIASKLESRGREITAELVPDREIRQIVEALWSEEMHGGYHHFYHRRVAGALATELVADAVGLSEAHARALLEVAETVKGFVLDARKDSLWELYRRTGNTAKLKAWLEEWLGDEGSLWGPTASSRESTLDELQPLVEELGEFELFDRAKRRANWLRITHRSHKDHSFRSLYMWLKTLGECEPTSWRDLGVTVLSVRQAARDAGCDNEYGSEIEELIAFLAYRSGPDDYRRLLLAHENMRDGEDHFGCLHSRTIAGAMEFVESIEGLDTDLAVAIWCLVLGWVRWNDPYDVRRLCGLKETLLAKTGSVAKRRALEGILENISPGEMSREPSRDDGHDRSTRVKESDGRTPLDFIRDVEAGSVIQPTAALAVVKHLQFTRPANYATILAQTLSQVGTASQYSGSWCFDDRDGGTALREIAKLISDSQRWDLVKSATRGSGYGGWIQSVTDNLFDVLLARAAAEGPIALRSGVEAMCDMHEHWLRGGKKSESMPVATLPSVDEKTTWADTVETSLDIILGSHSAEVVTAGLQATHAWVTARPDRISILFQRMRGNDWKLRFLAVFSGCGRAGSVSPEAT